MNYDYRHIAIDELTSFAEEHRDMTLGEILYSSLRNKYTGADLQNLHSLTKVSDQTFYSAINTAKKDEKQ